MPGHSVPATARPGVAVSNRVFANRALRHPTWLIPFIMLCILAGVSGALAVLERF